MPFTLHKRRSPLISWAARALVLVTAIATAVGVAWLALVVFVVPRLNAENRLPEAWVEKTRYDFGLVQQGEQLTTRFAIANRGGRRLIVREHSESCDCASANAEKPLVLSPGEMAYVTPLLDTSHLAGPVQIEFRYHTNDTRSPLLVFSALADVKPRPASDSPDRAITSVLVRS
jgi:hypothetical protein